MVLTGNKFVMCDLMRFRRLREAIRPFSNKGSVHVQGRSIRGSEDVYPRRLQ